MLRWCRQRESKLMAKLLDPKKKYAICIRHTPQNTPLAKVRLPHTDGRIGSVAGAAPLHGVQGGTANF